ncbi:MAG TPA: FmdB family zinc ribbon protein [Nitrospiria bacterium]|nr:FmdB family zinc ribbon protein [Nitrospiria bacterium]
MPIYEYECESCHHRVEVMQKINDPPFKTCEQCGGKLNKVISAPGIQFKGSGWYVTDYSQKLKSKEDKKPEAGKKKEPAAAAPKPDSSSKSDSAPKSDSPTKKESPSKS